MNNTLHFLFLKTKVYLVLFLSTLCMMATCESNTDPNLVAPSAQLQIKSLNPKTTIIDITSDGKTKPVVPTMTQVYPDDIVIVATGMQALRNIRRVTITLRYSDARCVQYSGSNSTSSLTITKPSPDVIQKSENTPGEGVPMWTITYNLKDYAALFQCKAGTVEVEMEVIVTVHNVAEKATELPPVRLKMKYPAQG